MEILDPDQIDISSLQQIAGVDQVINWFGFWPSFNDSEVLRITMERQVGEEQCCFGYLVDFITFDARVDPSDERRKNSLLTLFFKRPVKVSLSGFNYQNALNGLWIWREDAKFFVEFCGFGADATWECEAIEVVNIAKYSGEVIGFERSSR